MRDRLLSALDPLLKLVGCSNTQGVVVYKGLNVYAGNLDGGQIAITPGASYLLALPLTRKSFSVAGASNLSGARNIQADDPGREAKRRIQ